jgi:Fe-S-cluster-containing dehydrogenase component
MGLINKMKRIYIDLEVCLKCKECTSKCSYLYHPDNNGMISLMEAAMRLRVCRKCEEASCVKACPKNALEKQQDGSIKRFIMHCTGCKTCTLACPFGIIYPEIIPYLISQCDFCSGRLNEALPECVTSCPEQAIQYIDIEELKGKNIYLVGDNLAVHSIPWTPLEIADGQEGDIK